MDGSATAAIPPVPACPQAQAVRETAPAAPHCRVEMCLLTLVFPPPHAFVPSGPSLPIWTAVLRLAQAGLRAAASRRWYA